MLKANHDPPTLCFTGFPDRFYRQKPIIPNESRLLSGPTRISNSRDATDPPRHPRLIEFAALTASPPQSLIGHVPYFAKNFLYRRLFPDPVGIRTASAPGRTVTVIACSDGTSSPSTSRGSSAAAAISIRRAWCRSSIRS
jgi:hypothetical protein